MQCNVEENQCQQISKILYNFTPSKSSSCLLTVEPSNIVFLKTFDIDFDNITITFSNESGRSLEIKIKLI